MSFVGIKTIILLVTSQIFAKAVFFCERVIKTQTPLQHHAPTDELTTIFYNLLYNKFTTNGQKFAT